MRLSAVMPPHPTEACYCHVVSAGLENIDRLIAEGAASIYLQNELRHIRSVNRTLTDFLLYHPHDARWTGVEHDNYWDQIRPAYVENADADSVENMFVAWECLALATRGHVFYESIKGEGDLHRRDKLGS